VGCTGLRGEVKKERKKRTGLENNLAVDWLFIYASPNNASNQQVTISVIIKEYACRSIHLIQDNGNLTNLLDSMFRQQAATDYFPLFEK